MGGDWSGEKYEHENRGHNSTQAEERKPRRSRAPHRNQGRLEEPQRARGVSCTDDLSRGERPLHEIVAEGVPPNPPDLRRALP